MVCPKCGIEMTRKNATEWVCRNPQCAMYPPPEKKEEKENG